MNTVSDQPRSAWTIDRRGLRLAALASAVLLGLAAIVGSVGLQESIDRSEPAAQVDDRETESGDPDRADPQPAEELVLAVDSDDAPSRLPLVALAIGAVVFIVAAVTWLVRRSNRPPPAAQDTLQGVASSAEAIDLLDELLRPHSGGETPRQTIVRIYAALETGLGRAHLARRPHETPGRFVYRILGHHEALRGPLRDLVRAFEIARFSEHQVTEAMRDRATAALGRTRSHYAMHEVQAPTQRTWAPHRETTRAGW